MRTSTKVFAAIGATAALAIAGATLAHPGGGSGMGQGPGGMGPGWGPMGGMGAMGGGPGMMGGRGMMGGAGADMGTAAAGQLAALKAQLKITPAQEAAWKTYETTVTQQASQMQAQRDEFHAKWRSAKPGEAGPDMDAQRQAMFALRQASWQAQAKARQELDAVLTAEQRALAGSWHAGGMRHR